MSDESLRKYFEGYVKLYKNFLKQLSAEDRQSLVIAASSTNSSSGNKSVTFLPEGRFYYSFEWYALSKNEKDKVLKAHSNRNGGKKSTKSEGQSNLGGGRKMDMENGSLKLICLRRRTGTRRGSCWSLILWISLVQRIKSWMARKRNMGIGITSL